MAHVFQELIVGDVLIMFGFNGKMFIHEVEASVLPNDRAPEVHYSLLTPVDVKWWNPFTWDGFDVTPCTDVIFKEVTGIGPVTLENVGKLMNVLRNSPQRSLDMSMPIREQLL